MMHNTKDNTDESIVLRNDATKLLYTVLPTDVYYTRNTANPSYAVITIGASNTTQEDVVIMGIQIKLPVSNNVEDRNALTSDPSGIIPVSQEPLDWDFSRFDDGIYRATPVIAGTAVKPGESITFLLQDVMINEAPGTALTSPNLTRCLITLLPAPALNYRGTPLLLQGLRFSPEIFRTLSRMIPLM
jgi:hypothetical protein